MNVDVAVRNVARHVRYSPETIGNLYADDVDFYGLIYWHNDAIDSEKQIKKTGEKK